MLYEKNLNKLTDFKFYKQGWDGEKANPIPLITIELVDNILKQCENQPEIFPLKEGGIQLEWDNLDFYLEIEIYAGKTETFIILKQYKDENEFEFSETFSTEEDLIKSCLALEHNLNILKLVKK